MSLRLMAGAAATTAALLALPLTASARPDYQFDAGSAGTASADTTPVQASTPIVVEHDASGADTLTVIAIAGGTLLAGAAAGFGTSQLTARNQALRS